YALRLLPHHDFDTPVPGLGGPVRRRHEQVAFSASDRRDVGLRDAALDEHRLDPFGPLPRERVVVLVAADSIRVADDDDVAYGTLRDIGEHPLELGARLLREVVARLVEVEREMRGTHRLR